MPIVATHPVSQEVKAVTRYELADYGNPGVIWCPFCDHSYQDSKNFPACPKCRATRTDLTDEQFRDLLDPPLSVLVEREVATTAQAVEILKGSKLRMDALKERAIEENSDIFGAVVAGQETTPPAPEGDTSGEGTEGPGKGTPEPPTPITEVNREGWRAPTLEDGPMDSGRALHVICGQNYRMGAGAISHERHCKGAPEKDSTGTPDAQD